jgi:hypothetical protein
VGFEISIATVAIAGSGVGRCGIGVLLAFEERFRPGCRSGGFACWVGSARLVRSALGFIEVVGPLRGERVGHAVSDSKSELAKRAPRLVFGTVSLEI